MTQSDATSAQIKLQKNASEFFERTHEKYAAEMRCAKGCSRCCNVELNIFEVEATVIVEWFDSLPADAQEKLVGVWKSMDSLTEQPTETKKKTKACSFLDSSGQCSIYDARPVICRTQGAPLMLKKTLPNQEIQLEVDVCPLNFTRENSFPPQAEWLDLVKLNTLLSISENFFQKEKKGSEPALPKNKETRVPLKELKAYLISRLHS
jgi:Fe-S-cluster containining protein